MSIIIVDLILLYGYAYNAVYTRSASTARRTAATSGSSGSRLQLRGGTLVGRQRRLSWRRLAWCEFHFSQAVWRNVQSVVLQSAYVKDDVINRPRLPQDTDAIVSCRQMSLAMSSVNVNRWQLQEATLLCISPFKVIQGHQFWNQSKAHI